KEEQREEVGAYRGAAAKQDLVTRKVNRQKTGVFTGAYAINPATGQPIPIWIADYVLMEYGTGAIMAVPCHDERDFEFARVFGLPIIAVVQPDDAWLKANRSAEVPAPEHDWSHFRRVYRNNPGLFREVFAGEGIAINSHNA